jgi:hypothetical protein
MVSDTILDSRLCWYISTVPGTFAVAKQRKEQPKVEVVLKREKMSKKKKELKKKYQLTLDERQTQTLVAALDLFSRIGIGQFEEIVHHMRFRLDARLKEAAEGSYDYRKADLATKLMDLAKYTLFGHPPNGSYGIHSHEVPDEYRVAYDIQQVIRHELWKGREHTELTRFTVDADEPRQTVPDQPLALIKTLDTP